MCTLLLLLLSVCLGSTPRCVQSLLLAMCSGFFPGRTLGIICGVKSWTQLPARQVPCLLSYLSSSCTLSLNKKGRINIGESSRHWEMLKYLCQLFQTFSYSQMDPNVLELPLRHLSSKGTGVCMSFGKETLKDCHGLRGKKNAVPWDNEFFFSRREERYAVKEYLD